MAKKYKVTLFPDTVYKEDNSNMSTIERHIHRYHDMSIQSRQRRSRRSMAHRYSCSVSSPLLSNNIQQTSRVVTTAHSSCQLSRRWRWRWTLLSGCICCWRYLQVGRVIITTDELIGLTKVTRAPSCLPMFYHTVYLCRSFWHRSICGLNSVHVRPQCVATDQQNIRGYII